jgi:hypothetical protein
VHEVRHVWIDDGVFVKIEERRLSANSSRSSVIPIKRATSVEVKSSVGGWLQFPTSVPARSPFNRDSLCRLKLSTNDVRKAARAGRRQPVFELWSGVIGSPPPVPGVDRRNNPDADDLTSLIQAHACFRGIERPLAEDDDGTDVIAYVLRPRFFYEYDPNMVSLALRVPVPRDLVFITYARLLELSDNADEPVGVVTHWGFVEADPKNLRMPINSSTRYRERLW